MSTNKEDDYDLVEFDTDSMNTNDDALYDIPDFVNSVPPSSVVNELNSSYRTLVPLVVADDDADDDYDDNDHPLLGSIPRIGNTSSFICPPTISEGTDEATEEEDYDIEALAAKACALASTPIPDYADAFDRKDRKYKTKKYRDKEVQRASRTDHDPNSVKLASKTSNILNEFQDYLSEINTESGEGIGILEHRPVSLTTNSSTKSPSKGGDELRGTLLTEWNWDKKFSDAPNRKPSQDVNLYVIDDDDDDIHNEHNSNDSSPKSEYETGNKRRGYSYKYPFLHSKKFKVGIVSAIVFFVLLVAIIVITSSNGNAENVEEEYLERVEGVDQEQQQRENPQHAAAEAAPLQPDLELYESELDEFENAFESRPYLGLDTVDENANNVIWDSNYGLGDDDQGGQLLSDKQEQNLMDETDAGVPSAGDQTKEESSTNIVIIEQDATHEMEETETIVEELTQDQKMAYVAMFNRHHPRKFTRGEEGGWKGHTYDEAYEFCKAEQNVVCPYEAFCPMGPNSRPYGGYEDNDDDGEAWVPKLGSTNKASQWVPISDVTNEWVDLSAQEPCVSYSAVFNSLPDWGFTGEGSEDITRHVICCEVPVDNMDKELAATSIATDIVDYEESAQTQDGKVSGLPKNIGDSPPSEDGTAISTKSVAEATTTVASETTPTVEELTEEQRLVYVAMFNNHHPRKFTRGEEVGDWKGHTYDEAYEFCKARQHVMCPYQAFCPMGPNSRPYGGYTRDDVESNGNNHKSSRVSKLLDDNETLSSQWVPISDMTNEWVGLSANEPCVYYSDAYKSLPDWGITGEGNEEITRHVMCCEVAVDATNNQQGAVVGTTLASPTPPPAPVDSKSQQLVVEAALVSPTPQPAPLILSKPTSPSATSGMKKPTFQSAVTGYAGASPSVLEYDPVWYDRSNGWTGQTYDEAFSFCTKQGSGYDLCPYQAYCPSRVNGIPTGGVKDEGPNGSWAPVNDAFNEWVRVSTEDACVLYTEMNPSHPVWGVTGEGSEDVTRHVACCYMSSLGGGATSLLVVDAKETTDVLQNSEVEATTAVEANINTGGGLIDDSDVTAKYAPVWFRRDEESEGGWIGKSYLDAISHCARHGSSIPCPYEAYCPNGPGHMPFEGSRQSGQTQEVWAPIMDISNGWVNVGASSDACELYSSLHPQPPQWGLVGHQSEEELQLEEASVEAITSHIMCCREPPEGSELLLQTIAPSGPVAVASTKYEQDILDKKHPIWFTRNHGYHGTTHQEAAEFCKNMGDMVLCPADAYCPEGNTDPDRPLFLKNHAFEGEQWAPVGTTSTSPNEKWLLIGELDGNSRSTCSTLGAIRGMEPEGWDPDYDPDGHLSELKEHVMCCLSPNHLLKEINFAKELNRIWLDESFGWKGGSHDEAQEFCSKLGVNKQLCPYAAYCPHGPGQPVIGGHSKDFNMEGEQWAPASRGDSSYWIQIGRKYQNSATTCMDNFELEGQEPSWGASDERADLKKHIMCCDI